MIIVTKTINYIKSNLSMVMACIGLFGWASKEIRDMSGERQKLQRTTECHSMMLKEETDIQIEYFKEYGYYITATNDRQGFYVHDGIYTSKCYLDDKLDLFYTQEEGQEKVYLKWVFFQTYSKPKKL